MNSSSREVAVEVLPPGPLPVAPPPPPPPVPPAARAAAGPAVHPIAALLLLLVDNLWNLADWTILGWVLTVPLSFLSVAVPTFALQHWGLRQRVGQALGWSLLLGGIAAVPFSVGGTTIGAILLAWLGISRLSSGPAARG